MDSYLQGLIDKYNKWINKDLIEFSSKVVPVGESIDNIKHVIPSQQAMEILKNAKIVAHGNCICRTKYKNCDRPLDVCFTLNGSAERWIKEGRAKKIEIKDAKSILKRANQAGLVHMSLFQPDHEIFALCSCCPCCCHDLQLLMRFGKEYVTTKSDYIAKDDKDICINCGECEDRCGFSARVFENNEMHYEPNKCYGCGLCITTCPENAIKMVLTISV